MSPEQEAAEQAVRQVDAAIPGISLPPGAVTVIAQGIVAAVFGLKSITAKQAEAEGLLRAAKVTDVESAEAAAIERTK